MSATSMIADVIRNTYITATALIFNVVLCIIMRLLSAGRGQDNLKFRRIADVAPICNFVAITAYLVTAGNRWFFAYEAVYFIYLLSIVADIVIAYYFARYIESFFIEKRPASRFYTILNRIILLVVILVFLFSYLWYFPTVADYDTMPNKAVFFCHLLAYGTELYFFTYAMTVYINHRTLLGRRIQLTSMAAFLVTVIPIILEAALHMNMPIRYLGITLGMYLFYFGVETPDYQKLENAMKELEEERQRADNASKAKSDFLANMSHEIRTPINAVLGMNEMIIRESGDAQITEYARSVESAGRNLMSIINDILDFSKIESGKMEIIEAPYKLNAVLGDVLNMVSFRAKSKGLEFYTDINEMLPNQLVGDEIRVRQVILNVLNNAVKYTKEGSVTLTVKGERTPSVLTLVITVSDTGIGIREDDLYRLFQKFERIDLSQNKSVEGTGLGLAITHELLDMMGGSIEAESTYGKGSVFTIRLPQKVVSEEAIGNFRKRYEETLRQASSYHEDFQAPTARVLVVDDTMLNLTVVRGLLKKTKVKIDTASSGSDALTLTMDHAYDVILMDQRMPHMDGTQTLHHIRSQDSGKNTDTPVICLTADAVSGARERYLAEGFTDYLMKPVNGDRLEKMLLDHLPPEKVKMASEHYTRGKDRSERAVNEIHEEDDVLFFEPEETGEDKVECIRRIYQDAEELSYEDALRYLVDEELLTETVLQFCRDIPENAEAILTYSQEHDYDDYTIKVHALKSSSRMIGATAFSRLAALLEIAGGAAKEGDEEAIKRIAGLTPVLLKGYQQLGSRFSAVMLNE
ncbi:MAG: response regulator [Lachnospiraceae bacterium]|nr:response regulator [Lachnospiraceae bacterium]